MGDKFINLTDLGALRAWVLGKLGLKQDTLVSGTNIKTINNMSLLGNGNISIQSIAVFVAVYNITTYEDLCNAINDGKSIIVTDIPHGSSYVTAIVNNATDDGTNVVLESIATSQSDLWDITLTISERSVWTEGFVSRDPFMLLDFQQQINASIPYCTEEITNTSIPNVDISINDTLGADWAIASLAKFEVYDATSGGNRINCWPICQFSMNTQKTLRLRMMCAGTSRKTARRIAGAILLKHR